MNGDTNRVSWAPFDMVPKSVTGRGRVLSENTLSRGGVVGGVSDPQNCKIQKVPGYFLKTKLGIF